MIVGAEEVLHLWASTDLLQGLVIFLMMDLDLCINHGLVLGLHLMVVECQVLVVMVTMVICIAMQVPCSGLLALCIP
jgi:hypothetical protein